MQMANPFPHSLVVYFDFALTQDLNICSSMLAPQLLLLNTPQYLLLTAQYPYSVFAFFSFRMPLKRSCMTLATKICKQGPNSMALELFFVLSTLS
jgi:hypothetical protein